MLQLMNVQKPYCFKGHDRVKLAFVSTVAPNDFCAQLCMRVSDGLGNMYISKKTFYFSYRVMRMRRFLGPTVSLEKALVSAVHIFNLLRVVWLLC